MTVNNNDGMNPDDSPDSSSGVRRVNNLPMIILGVVVIGFVIIMVMVGVDRASQSTSEGSKEAAGNSSMFAAEIAGDHQGGLVGLDQNKEGQDEPIPNRDNLGKNSAPTAPMQPMVDEDARRIRMMKLQMLQQAALAKTGVTIARSSGGGASGANPSREEMLAKIASVRQQIEQVKHEDPTKAYQLRLAQLQGGMGGGGMGGGMGGGSQLPASSPGQNSLTKFQGGEGDRWRLDSRSEAPRSPYELRAGFVVPATLISGINSDLPGQIIGQVAQNVYDTPTGRHLLIPQGSRLVGAYESNVAYGQARVLVAWQRIVFPDGRALDIGAMSGTDGAGYAGFNDKVNNHYFRMFGSALLMSAVTAGVSLSQDTGSSGFGEQQSASGALSEALGQQLGQVTAQLIAKNMSIAPTLEIRPGFRFNVMVTKDLTFLKPYRPFDYPKP